ncbi:hypothetical protein M0804_013293 [Polistes exclamans]|nr:hypothetical protein M0804_013293 [Polistes exclamans]
MNNKDSLNENDQITYYSCKALAMILPYSPDEEEMFLHWINKFEYIADVIEVPDNKMLQFFHNMIDKNTRIRIENNYYYVNFFQISYEDTIQLYHRYFDNNIKTNLNDERFFTREQYRREPLEKYAINLRKIYDKCSYSIGKEDKLCDQFIKGIRETDLRNYLLQIRGLRFEEMVEKAVAFAKENFITYYLDYVHLVIRIYTREIDCLFCHWFNRFEYVTGILKVPDDKILIIFKEMVDNDIHMDIKKTFYLVEFSKLSYIDTINYYLHYFSPPNEYNLHGERFLCRNQYEDEKIEDYADNLQKIWSQCFFENSKEKILCEKFVNGLRDDELRTDLKNFDGLRMSNMLAMALKFERINRITTYIQPALTMINFYNQNKEGIFYLWLNKFEYVADFVKVPNKKMVEFFNNMVDQNVHTSVKTKFLTVNFSELTYEQIIDYYLRYFATDDETNLYRNRFICRNQYEEETIENYANRLRKIYNMCGYESNPEERLLCERFINGMLDNDLRNLLKGLSCLSFDEMVQFAVDYPKTDEIHYHLNAARPMIPIYKSNGKDLFYVWLNKFEFVADYIGVPKFRMSKFFNKMVDHEVHTSVKNNYPSVDFSVLLYEEIAYRYLRYLSSSKEIYLHRTRFMCRHQYENETIMKYADNLRKLYYKCWYECNQEEILCEQFLNGIRCDKTKTELKKHSGLSFTEIILLASQCVEHLIETEKNTESEKNS